MGAGASALSGEGADVIGGKLTVEVASGHDLLAADGGMFSKKTSDPYVKVTLGSAVVAKSEVAKKDLNPVWNLSAEYNVGPRARKTPTLVFTVYDYDMVGSDDPLGAAEVPLKQLLGGAVFERKLALQPCTGCKKAKGEIAVRLAFLARKALTLTKGGAIDVENAGHLALAMGWDMLPGNQAVDVDASVVAFDDRGRVLMDEVVYFADLINSNKTMVHSGDEQEGDEDLGCGDDEVIRINTKGLSSRVKALMLVGTVATEGKTFQDIRSARARVVNLDTDDEHCRIYPATAGAYTCIIVACLFRTGPASWHLSVIDDYDSTARDFGSVVPELQGYLKPLIPSVEVREQDRVALMRKGGTVALSDFAATASPDLTFGLAWDITNGANIDLDASAICLDANLRCVDLVFFQKLRSTCGGIQHGGDEREGDEKGDDEKIHLHLNLISPSIQYIGFCINSYSGQELDDVSKTVGHLYTTATMKDLASYKLSGDRSLDKKTALIMAVLYRDVFTNPNEWCLRICSVPAMGRTAQDNVDELQRELQHNPIKPVRRRAPIPAMVLQPPQGYAQPQPGQPAMYAPQPGQPMYAPQPGQPAMQQPGQPMYAPQPGQQMYAPQPGQPMYAPQPGQPMYAPQPGNQPF